MFHHFIIIHTECALTRICVCDSASKRSNLLSFFCDEWIFVLRCCNCLTLAELEINARVKYRYVSTTVRPLFALDVILQQLFLLAACCATKLCVGVFTPIFVQ